MKPRSLIVNNLNPGVRKIDYAIRGPLAIRAAEIKTELQNGVKKPFTEVINANLGDGHAFGQIPITFIREVLALIVYPPLLDDPRFPEDKKQRARDILTELKGSVGTTTDSAGLELVRRHVAKYIETRDAGIVSDWQNIVLCPGAAYGIRSILKLLAYEEDGVKSGVMIPVPQFPLYSGSMSEFDIHRIDYYLNEARDWALDISELERSITEARKCCNPRAIVVINPGNPTGQVLTRENIEDVIKFAYRENLFILADEVYQYNVYAADRQFHSFKKVLVELGAPYCNMELASFMSCSKGYTGENGLRSGYVEIINMDPEVRHMHVKAITSALCPTTVAQALMYCVVNPPQPDEESFEKFTAEKTKVLDSFKIGAKIIEEMFNSMDGVTCNPVQGAMYAFPQIRLPEKAVAKAKEAGHCHADVYYAFQLLESTGICIVPGSGFGQKPGTFHFRITVLPVPEKLRSILETIKMFHQQFMLQYK